VKVQPTFIQERLNLLFLMQSKKWLRWSNPWASGVDFTNILETADLKSAKRQSSHQCLFSILGSTRIKASCTMLVKLTPHFYDFPFNKLIERSIIGRFKSQSRSALQYFFSLNKLFWIFWLLKENQHFFNLNVYINYFLNKGI